VVTGGDVFAAMGRALELARRGRIGASPNPMVGAVVLDGEGQVVGEGYHALAGGPHAEVVALSFAGDRARGGTVVVTLEPCAHHGKTPPCTDALVAAGVRRVVAAMRDPTPAAGGGMERLHRAGLEVTLLEGDAGAAARALNRRWLRRVTAGRPWVTLKAGTSLDGRIAAADGGSQWITGEAARRRGLELREEHDAILVGVGTVLADDPQLTRRLGLNPGPGWRRVVLDSRLRTPPESRVVRQSPEQTLLVCTPAAPTEARRTLEQAGARVLEVPAGPDGRVDLEHTLRVLALEEVSALLVEGGSAMHGAFADAGLVDEVVFFVAPMLLGGAALPAVGGRGVTELRLARRLRFEETRRLDGDLELRAVVVEETDVHRAD
jgi:diaminohydroxyphosphoribosylaminopyrimidine deaminase/5-amino-6-(5-phosphoribosylamino)uracil reductase